MRPEWYIWSYEHNAWWKPNSRGYTHDLREAGRYGWSAATEILHHANFGDTINEAVVATDAFVKEA